MPVLDTDILTIIQRRSQPAYDRLRARLATLSATDTVWVTIISFEEQLRGWLEYIKRSEPDRLPAGYEKLATLNADFQHATCSHVRQSRCK